MAEEFFRHPTSEIEEGVSIGSDTWIWHHVHIRRCAKIGDNVHLGKNVFVDHDVVIGNNVKIQNNVSVYYGVTIEDDAFVGPNVCFTNDRVPRSVTADRRLKSNGEWRVNSTLICLGASVGAGSVILAGIRIGRYAMIGAGSVVTGSVPDHGLYYGNPAKLHGYVCDCGTKFEEISAGYRCVECGKEFALRPSGGGLAEAGGSVS